LQSSKSELTQLLEPFKSRLETNSDIALLFEDVIDTCIYNIQRNFSHGFDSELNKFRSLVWDQSKKEELRAFIRDAITGTKNVYTKVSLS
jgi:hypothetical protein